MRQLTTTILTMLCFTAFSYAQTIPKSGILLLAHGGQPIWNKEVLRVAEKIAPMMPVEIAFGMASKRAIQDAVDRLVAQGVEEIIAVPLFISSYSSVITATEYLLGLRGDAPPELARYARMSHGHSAHDTKHSDLGFDPTTPITSPVPIRMTSALNDHPIVADILLSRAVAISKIPQDEAVIIVAHGPVPDEDNAKWLRDMGVLADRMRAASPFGHIECLTVRDDALEPVRSKATADLRARVERARGDGKTVLILPLLLSFGGIEQGIRKRLDGLDYIMSDSALLPDERIVRWVLKVATEDSGGIRSQRFIEDIQGGGAATSAPAVPQHFRRFVISPIAA